MPTERVGSDAVLERTEHCPSRGPAGVPESRNTCCRALRAAAAAARHRGAKEMWIRVKDSKEEFVGQQIFLQNLQREANTLICNSLWRCIVEEIDLQHLHHLHHSERKSTQVGEHLKLRLQGLTACVTQDHSSIRVSQLRVALGAVPLMMTLQVPCRFLPFLLTVVCWSLCSLLLPWLPSFAHGCYHSCYLTVSANTFTWEQQKKVPEVSLNWMYNLCKFSFYFVKT